MLQNSSSVVVVAGALANTRAICFFVFDTDSSAPLYDRGRLQTHAEFRATNGAVSTAEKEGSRDRHMY